MLMTGMHEPLRREWAETPPDVSYRYVVSLGTLQAADSVSRAVLQEKRRWWQRALAFFLRDVVRMIFGALTLGLLAWFALQPALLVDRAWDAADRPGGPLLPVLTFLAVFLALWTALYIANRRLLRSSLRGVYREFYAGTEFLLEGRKSHLWFDEQSAGAIRRWSTFGRLVEFDEGLWLFLRRRTTFAGQRGILVSKQSLPGSCAWSELKAYLTERIAQTATDTAEAQEPSRDPRASG
jgi:hypothetical protein